MALMPEKRNSYQSKSLVHEALRAQSVLALQKDAFQNTDFSSLKCQLKQIKIDTPSLQRFSKFQPMNEWVNKVRLSSFLLENVFKFVLARLAREEQNILTPQPCFHTLMQTPFSANQSARTILVIL